MYIVYVEAGSLVYICISCIHTTAYIYKVYTPVHVHVNTYMYMYIVQKHVHVLHVRIYTQMMPCAYSTIYVHAVLAWIPHIFYVTDSMMHDAECVS